MNLSKRLFAFSFAPFALAIAAAGAACTSDTDLGNTATDAGVDGTTPDSATPDAGPATDAATATDSATATDAATVTDAGPQRCSDLGEASGTTVTVVPAMSPATTSFSVDENCGGIHFTRTASLGHEVRRCPYAGCVAAAITTYPVQRGGTMVVAAGAQVFTGEPTSQNGTPGSTLSVGPIDLSAPQTILSATPAYPFGGPLQRWGTEVVFERHWYGTGTPHELFLSQSGSAATPVFSLVNAANGAFGFTARTATEGYVFAAGGASQSGPRNELTKLTRGAGAPTRVQAVAPASITGNYPMQTWLNGLSQIVALPEALLVVRNVNNVLDLRTCDYAAATPCATEATNATPTATLTGTFFTAHNRVYAVRSVGGQSSLVQCASSAFVAGTCAWAPFGAPIPAGATYGTFDSDDDHVYAMVVPSTGSPEVLRIAK